MHLGSQELAQRYWEHLQDYLQDTSEAQLHRGYELGRSALVEGCGMLEVAAIHHWALKQLIGRNGAGNGRAGAVLNSAGDFFAECVSPFEMCQRNAQDGMRALRHLNDVLEGELKRIAHALHDEAGQLLASVHVALSEIAEEAPPRTLTHIDEVKELLRQVETELRNLSHDLRPTVLDNLGTVPALELLAERVSKRTSIDINITGGTGGRLPAQVETTLYRVVQEAINNVVKHAAATSVTIRLRRTGCKLACVVRDNGCGFDIREEQRSAGLGLIGIRERLAAVGGSVQIVSRAERGTTLMVDIPLPHE
ncbi:MAG: hypothetical protein IT494_09035 [Gammaproteobacteria bacterium]|nr:hypothetical protein [Gammaproteobacteria bacterium]